MRKLTLIILGTILLFGLPGFALDAVDVLARSLSDWSATDYVGEKTLIMYNGSNAEALEMLITYQAEGVSRTDYLSPPSMRDRIIIDDGGSLYSYDPHLDITVCSPSPQRLSLSLSLSERKELIAANYTVSLETGFSIAGRDAYRLKVFSNDNFTPRRIILVDAENYLPLSSKEEFAHSAVTSSFSWIEFNNTVDDDIFDAESLGAPIVEESAPSRSISQISLGEELAFTALIAEELPGGFRLIDTMLTDSEDGSPATHLSYSDGIEGLSVFEEAELTHHIGREISLGSHKVYLSRSANYSVLQLTYRSLTITLVGRLTRYGMFKIAAFFLNGEAD